MRDTLRVASNRVSREVVEILNRGGQFEDVRELVAAVRARKVFEDGDVDTGIWTVDTAMASSMTSRQSQNWSAESSTKRKGSSVDASTPSSADTAASV